MGRDDDLFGAEGAQCVLYRLEGIGVAHLTACVDTGLAKGGKALIEALLGCCPCPVLV